MYQYKYKGHLRLLLEASQLFLTVLTGSTEICIIGILVHTAERPQWNTLKAS